MISQEKYSLSDLNWRGSSVLLACLKKLKLGWDNGGHSDITATLKPGD